LKWEKVGPGRYRRENVEIERKGPGRWVVWRRDDLENMVHIGECSSLKEAKANVEKCFGSHPSLNHLTFTQRKILLSGAADIVAGGNELLSWNQARELVVNETLDEILDHFPGNKEDYCKRGIEFNPRTGQPWTEKGVPD